MWNFVIYCGKNEKTEEVVCVDQEKARLAHKVVLDLATDVQGKEHVISIHNFFTFVGLFDELASMQIYATGIVRSN
jgi:hypothetical protein